MKLRNVIASVVLGTLIGITAWAGLESGTYINSLVVTNPTSSDLASQGDDHLRLLKSTIKSTFPNLTGAVTPTQVELNYVDGVTSALQTQIDAKLASSGYTAADVLTKLLTVDGPGSLLDADTIDGVSSASFLSSASYTAADVLAKLITVDGSGSGLDADLLDGQSSAFYLSATNINAGTLAVARGGTGVGTSTGTGNTVLSASPTLTGTVTAATVAATTLTQGGSGVWTAANDGAASGLDADLLDGSSSAAFAAASHAHSAADITSGTLAIARGGTNTTDGTARNITGKAGTAKTLSTSAASGGSDGDIWYKY